MILRIHYEDDPRPTDVAANPTEAQVVDAVHSMDWSRFGFVTLHIDESNWLEGSGCLEPGFGLSMMLSDGGVQYVTETAPPTPESMLPIFNAYLQSNTDLLYCLLYDAESRGLAAGEIEELRREEEATQMQRIVREVMAEAAPLFSQKDYATFIEKLAPYEQWLTSMDQKKLAIARKKLG